MFRKIAARLSRPPTPAPKPPLTVPELRADLLAKGLSAEEASGIIVQRLNTASRYWQAKGYTHDQFIFSKLDDPDVYAIPTGKADRELYWECYRQAKSPHYFNPRDYTPA